MGRRSGAFLFLLPWAALFALFYLFPFVFSVVLSLSSYDPLAGAARFVGMGNYARLLHDQEFLRALGNTALFVVVTVPVTTLLALLLAFLVSVDLPGQGFFRASYFFPSVVSMVVVSLLFKLLYAPQGPLNSLLRAVGLPTPSWLTDPRTALPAIMAMDVWTAMGYYAVIFYAALRAIPRELYEAAEIEGAGTLAKVRHVSLPSLRPVIAFVLVINTIRSFQIFVEVFVMTQGGPMGATDTVVLHLYDTAFRKLQYGYASAMAYVVFLVSGLFSWVILRRMRSAGRPVAL